jgi:hypothetical protein
MIIPSRCRQHSSALGAAGGQRDAAGARRGGSGHRPAYDWNPVRGRHGEPGPTVAGRDEGGLPPGRLLAASLPTWAHRPG